MKTNKASIGDKIKAARSVKGLNQTEFAEKLGISRSKLLALEGPQSNPDYKFLLAFSDLTGQSISWCFGEETPSREESPIINTGIEILKNLSEPDQYRAVALLLETFEQKSCCASGKINV